MAVVRPAEPERPLPVVDLDSEPFWNGLRQHKLLLQRCADCKHYRHPPMPMCPSCNSFEQEWVESAGRGTVYSWITVHQQTHPFFTERPYNVVLVELEEGVRVFANLLDVAPDRIRADLPVRVDFLDLGPADDSFTLLQFRPVEA